MFAKHPSVQVTRNRSDFYPSFGSIRSYSTSGANGGGGGATHTAFLGIGTNLGDKVGNFANALKRLREIGKEELKIVDSSFLYESEAMYHEDQDTFLNAAIKVRIVSLHTSLCAIVLILLRGALLDRNYTFPSSSSRRPERSRSEPRKGFLNFPKRSSSDRSRPPTVRRPYVRTLEGDGEG